jgi:outer membrane protein OmpA-like peptidoglycan-associated protein
MEVSAETVRSSTVAQRPSLTPASTRLLQRKCACGGTAPSGECDSCQQQDVLRRQPIGPDASAYGAVPPSVHEVLRSPGNPLPPASRAFFESGFGHDFAKVRIHTDARASESARNVNARAYTVGGDIVFGRGEYDPHSSAGRHLLAHELAHVVQQSGPGSAGEGVTRIGDTNDAAESHAQQAANLVTSAHRTAALAPVARPAVQRFPLHPPKTDPAKMSRAQEVKLSKTSVGQITGGLNPPMISFYNFAIDQPTLKPEHHAAIEALASVIKRAAVTKVYIAANGHADSSGDEVENQPLSRHRAIAVQSLLEQLSGKPIDPSWFGATQPVAGNDTVDGRSRNRRVDVSIKATDGIHHIEEDHKKKKKPPPHNGDDDDDDDNDHGHKWHLPNPCGGLLGAWFCGIVACALAPEICLFCFENPEVCFDWPRPPKTPEKEKPENARKACPIHFEVTDPPEIDPYAWAVLKAPFKMNVVFKQETPDKSPYCDCNCGEYRQYVSGYFIESGYYGGPATPRKHTIAYGKEMTRNDCLEDGPDPYGHRYKTDLARLVSKDQARLSLKANNDASDKFLLDRQDGCEYKGTDAPGIEYSPQTQEVHFHLKFYGGPYDACNNLKVGEWKKWEVGPVDRVPPSSTPPKTQHGGTFVEPRPATGKVEGTAPVTYLQLLDQNPTVGNDVKLEVGFELDGESFYSLIDVEVIAVSPADVTVWTLNTEPLNIAPEGHRQVLVRPNYSQTIPR